MRLHGILVPSSKARPGNKKLLVSRIHSDKQPCEQRCRFQVSFLDKWDSSLQKSDFSFAYLIVEREVPRMTAMKVAWPSSIFSAQGMTTLRCLFYANEYLATFLSETSTSFCRVIYREPGLFCCREAFCIFCVLWSWLRVAQGMCMSTLRSCLQKNTSKSFSRSFLLTDVSLKRCLP